MLLVFIVMKPCIFTMRDFNVSLDEGIRILFELEKKIIKLIENEEQIIYNNFRRLYR